VQTFPKAIRELSKNHTCKNVFQKSAKKGDKEVQKCVQKCGKDCEK